MSKNTRGEIRLDQPLPDRWLKALIQSELARTREVQQNELQWVYPDPDEVDEFDDVSAADLGFPTAGEQIYYDPKAFRRRHGQPRRRPQGGGNKGRGKGKGKRPPSLPDPAMIHAEVTKAVQHIPHATSNGTARWVEFNGEFLDDTKANYFKDTYIELFSRAHLVFLIEVAKAGVNKLAQLTGYQGYCSTENNRRQAVGFLVHPRYKVLKVTEHHTMASVQGVPDLRPGLELYLEDTVTGEKCHVVVVHLKSMRGGPKVTSVVRYRQFQALLQDLGANWNGTIAGDMNFPLNNSQFNDADPLYQAGFVLVESSDPQATQILGSRLDGYFIKGLPFKLGNYTVVAFFLNQKLGRLFTDHAGVFVDVQSQSGSGKGGGNTTTGTQRIGGDTLPIILQATSTGRGGRRNRSRD